MIVGPHVPIPLVADEEIVQTLSELGVILLMFSLGLEFSLRKLVQGRADGGARRGDPVQRDGLARLRASAGSSAGRTLESVFAGAHHRDLQHDDHRQGVRRAAGQRASSREIVVGILIVEDLIAILLIAVLTRSPPATAVSAATLCRSPARACARSSSAFIGVGLLVVPRIMRAVVRLEPARDDARRQHRHLLRGRAARAGVRLLGGARRVHRRLAGRRVGRGEVVEHLIRPVRDMFAAIFFVSVGMLIDPASSWSTGARFSRSPWSSSPARC